MDTKHLTRLGTLVLGGFFIAAVLLRLPHGRLLFGVSMLLSAAFFESIEGWVPTNNPSYLAKFSASERQPIDKRQTGSARAVLLLLGILHTVLGLQPMPPTEFPWVAYAVGIIVFMVMFLILELVRSRVANKAETYEQYTLNMRSITPLVAIPLMGLMFFLTYLIIRFR